MQPRIVIAALRGGAGKTMVSLGLASAWCEKGYRIAPFKKGPDFIDAGWLTFAADRSCYNLDPFLMNRDQVLESFVSHSSKADLSLIEGNRGLYDGLDLEGRCSTAEVAKILQTPVLIVLDVTMTTRTTAAVLKGCQVFDPELRVAGAILNRMAGSRQETLIRAAVEKYCGIPVVGSVPKLKEDPFPERHMGLVPFQERDHAEKAVSRARKIVEENLDLGEIWGIAQKVERIEIRPDEQGLKPVAEAGGDSPRIGFIKDRSFWFYYPENLMDLVNLGGVTVEIDAISDPELPPLDALYIGGGFPETQARLLSDNQRFRDSLRKRIEEGLPVYAECGGFMYLGESLVLDGRTYPMVGALPVEFVLQKKPQGHGYTILEVEGKNPYYPVGEVLKGHEFHYSKAVLTGREGVDFAFRVRRGNGIDGERDGILKKNVLATYTHIHAAGTPVWARNLFDTACRHRKNE